MTLSFQDDKEKTKAKRGDIQLELASPQQTNSILLPYMARDTYYNEGYTNWPFISVHFWGEDQSGSWTLNVIYRGMFGTILIENVTFTFFGTANKPQVIARIPNNCDIACARGCAAAGPQYCDSCNEDFDRNPTTLVCMKKCSEGFENRMDDECVPRNKNSEVSNEEDSGSDAEDPGSAGQLHSLGQLTVVVLSVLIAFAY